ncbi:hypothetical protein [Pseudomonas koreensis]|uniref:hypothetical protein n=1 Tax=Pseudomonas koreensis TaxID=198620 RepID=UPI00320A05F8
METDQGINKSQGEMKGTVLVKSGIGNIEKTINFKTTIVHRFDDQGLGLEVAGLNEAPLALISLRFKKDRQHSDNFTFPSSDIQSLAFVDGEFYPRYPAQQGEVMFENHDGAGELRVNGRLNFVTQKGAGGRYCEVDVVFSVTGITKPLTTLDGTEKRLIESLRAEASQLNKLG